MWGMQETHVQFVDEISLKGQLCRGSACAKIKLTPGISILSTVFIASSMYSNTKYVEYRRK